MTVSCHKCDTTVSKCYKLIDSAYYCEPCADRLKVNNLAYEATTLGRPALELLHGLLGDILADEVEAEVNP